MQGDALERLGLGPNESSYRIAASGSYWRLRDYGAESGSRPILIVGAPIKRPYVWDLSPAVSAIRYCRGKGLHVHLLEWLPASHETSKVGIDDSVTAISAALAGITSTSSGGKPLLIGHSLGGTLAAIAAAADANAMRGLVLLGAPLCFEPQESEFRDALVSLVPSEMSDSGPCPGSVLSEMSALASPDTFIWSRLMDAAASVADARAMDVHARIERWALDEVALPGKLVSEIIQWLYRENRFCRGILEVGNKMIGPSSLTVPTLAVVNKIDAVAPLASVRPIADAAGPDRFQIIEYPGESGVGLQHLAILVGRGAFEQVWPKIINWIDARAC
jgi:polyhydroxyalkanoate synthase